MRLRLYRAWTQFYMGIVRAVVELFHRHHGVPDFYLLRMVCAICRRDMGETDEMRDLFSREVNTIWLVDAEGNITQVEA